MKITQFLSIILGVMLLNSCLDSNETPSEEVKIKQSATNFLNWYEANHEEILKQNANIISLGSKGVYIFNQDGLSKFVNILTKSGNFSKSFLKVEYESIERCGKALQKESVSDGPPPCIYQADPLLLSQDGFTTTVETLGGWGNVSEITSIHIEGQNAWVEFMQGAPRKLPLILENEKWKLNGWSELSLSN